MLILAARSQRVAHGRDPNARHEQASSLRSIHRPRLRGSTLDARDLADRAELAPAKPELPEVEDARRELSRWPRGVSIVSARAFDAVIMRPRAPATLARDFTGRRVERVERRGKWLRIVSSGDGLLFSHSG